MSSAAHASPAAVSDFVLRHYPSARAHAARMTDRHDRRDDIAQDGALVLMRAARRFDPTRGTPESAYVNQRLRRGLSRAARRFDLIPPPQRFGPDAKLKRAACPKLKTTSDESAFRLAVDGRRSAEAEVDDRDSAKYAAAVPLSDRDRAMVELYAEGWTTAEIGSLVGLTTAETRDVIKRALDRMRARLEGERGER